LTAAQPESEPSKIGELMNNNLFITLTDTTSNRQLRLQVNQIVGYGVQTLHISKETVTAVYTTHPEIGVIFVSQTPEQLDKYLAECYYTVKGEP